MAVKITQMGLMGVWQGRYGSFVGKSAIFIAIDGASTQTLAAQYDTITIVSDGTSYWIVDF